MHLLGHYCYSRAEIKLDKNYDFYSKFNKKKCELRFL